MAGADAGMVVFETAIGHCSLAWGPRGLTGVQLPEVDGSAAAKRARLHRDIPDLGEVAETQRPLRVRAAIEAIRALLAGDTAADRALLSVTLDEEGVPDFHRRVYALARRIPPGETRTYGELADALGDKTLARAVGQALGANPWPIVVPCHRILAAGGRKGGFSAPGGADTKLRMLEIEGALAPDTLPLFGGR